MRDMSDPFALPDRRFSELFRLNKDLVTYLFNNLVPHLEQEQRQTRVPGETRILIALRFFATGNYQRGVVEEFILSSSQQVVSRCIEEVAQCVSHHLGPLWVKFPAGNETRNQVKASFMEKAGFPGIIVCIDCTHIAILAPSEEEHNYVNRKGFHSKNVQIICNSDLQLTNINSRYPGSTNDAFIWRGSQVKDLLGDSGYPLEPWLMTPHENPDPETPEGCYNRSHKITRSIIERCNGRLTQVFRCLLGERKLRYNPQKVGHLVNACAVLHNLCIHAGVEFEIEPLADNVNVFSDNIQIDNNVLNMACLVRQEIVQRYFQ